MGGTDRSRRALLSSAGAVVGSLLAGCTGGTRRRDAAAGPERTTDHGEHTGSGHDVGIVCYNADDEPRAVSVVVRPTTGARDGEWSFDLPPDGSATIPGAIEEPVPGSVEHAVVVRAGERERATFRANSVHDLHDVHVVVDADDVAIKGVRH